MPGPPKRKPAVQDQMLAKYRKIGPQKRMQMALDKVMIEGLSQSEAARDCGVSRPRLNEHVRKARAKLAEMAERSAVAAVERRAEPVVVPAERPVLVMEETRRVPDFAEFDRRYFATLECFDCGVHHETPQFHYEIMSKITDPTVKRLLVNMPPGHSKSTIGTIKSTVYELCRDPNSITAIVSKSQTLAKKFLYSINKYLSDETLYDGAEGNLIQDWGPFQSGEPWSGDRIYVAGRQSAEKDPSVATFGVGGHIYGIRAHRMIMDDVADLENQANAERVNAMQKWCTQEAGSRVGRHGKLIFIGTRVSAGDIYSHLQSLPGYESLRYPCIMDEESKTTLWPDHFPFEAADLQRNSMTSDQWQLVYQNVDTPGFGASFPPDVVEACRDMTRTFGRYEQNWALVAGLDPAGANSQAGYTALVLMGVDLESGKYHLVDMVNTKQMKAPQLQDQIFDWADRYPLRELRVESNGLQSQLVQWNQQIAARMTTKGVRVVPHITSGHNKWDPNFGVEGMAPMFYNHQITTPAGDVASRNRLRVLEEQLAAFPMGRTTDLVMAMWFAWLGCKDIQQRSIAPLFDNRRHMPNRITKHRRVFDFSQGKILAPQAAEPQSGRPMFLGGKMLKPVQMINVDQQAWVEGD